METVNSTTNTTAAQNSNNSKDTLQAFLDAIQGKTYRPYTTDIPFFDDLLGGGLIRKTLTILLAAPGAGKTALCAQIGEAMAEHGKPVLYLNLEMSRDQMLARSISSRATIAGVPTTAMQVMQGYAWTEEQKKTIPAVIEEYRQKVYPNMRYKPDKVEPAVEGLKSYLQSIGKAYKDAGKEAPVVVLDYLHLVTGAGDPQEVIKQTIFALKEYAVNYDTVSIAISAVNRDSMNGGNISMTSGRDSSGIEFTGDNLLGLNFYECEVPKQVKSSDGKKYIDNPEYVDPKDPVAMGALLNKETRRMVLRVLKGRFIAPGRTAKLQFHAPTAHFYGENDFIPANVKQVPFEQMRRR